MTMTIALAGALVFLVGAAGVRVCAEDAALKERVDRLEQRVTELEKQVGATKGTQSPEARRELLQKKARERMRQDAATYSAEQLREIESLYQVANKNWNTPEAKESLEKLIGKYGKANRTGCAVLYLGQMSEGDQREKYLKTAIENHGDCWYGDGVQVGAYARYYLAFHYQKTGNKDGMEKLVKEIRENYPDAIDHRGRPLVDRLPSVGGNEPEERNEAR